MSKTVSADVPQSVIDLANAIQWDKVDEQTAREGLAELEAYIATKLTKKQPGRNYPGAGGQKIRKNVPQWVLDKLSEYDYSPVPSSRIMQNMMKGMALNKLRERGIPLYE